MSDLSRYLKTEFRDHSTVRRGHIPAPASPDMGRVLMGLDSLHLYGPGPQLPVNPVACLEAREERLPEEKAKPGTGGGFFAALRRAVLGGPRTAIKS